MPPSSDLPAGHGDGVVVEDLVGHVHAGRARRTNGEAAGVDVGAVTQVLEHVLGLGEGRLADPVGALAAHLGEPFGRAVHPVRHEVASDAGIRARALRHHGRRVVRAAGAEIGNAGCGFRGLWLIALQPLQLADLAFDVVAGAILDEPLTELDGDVGRIERILRREQPLVVLVLLAQHARAIWKVVELLLDLRLDQRAFLLHHEDDIEPLRELHNALRLQRPGHADLVETDAERIGANLVDAKFVQRLAHVEVALAGGDDAEFWICAAAGDDAVELVGTGEGENGCTLVVMQAGLLGQRLITQANSQAAGWHREIVGNLDLDAVDAAVDRRGRLDIVLHALDADPHAGKARQPETQDAVIENLLHARGIEDRHHVVEEGELRLMCAGRTLAGMIVTHQCEHTAVLGGAGMVGVTEDVARAVDAGALAVPDAEHAVVLAFPAQFRLL